MGKSLISVIVPLYKGKEYVTAVIKQLEDNAHFFQKEKIDVFVELIFVNDYPDEKIEIKVDASSNLKRIVCINLIRNIGIHGARLTGLQQSKGEFILFFDQDDKLDKRFLLSQYKNIGISDAILANGWYRNGRKIYSDIHVQEYAVNPVCYLKGEAFIVSPGQMLIKKCAIPNVWMEHSLVHNGCDDVFLWITMMANNALFACNPECLYVHQEDGRNNSFKWEEMILARMELNKAILASGILKNHFEWVAFFHEGNENVICKYIQYLKIDKLLENVSYNNIPIFPFRKVAVYGMGVYGKILCKLLSDINIKVLYAIDRNAGDIQQTEFKIYYPKDSFPDAEVVIVTAIFAFDEVKKKIQRKLECPIIRMDDLLEKLQRDV